MVQLYNGMVLLLICVGVSLHKRRHIHVPIMISAFTLDMISVLYLEFSRGVIQEALAHASAGMLQLRLVFAATTLLGYAIAIYTGRKLLKGAAIYRIHRTNAMVFLVARTGVLVTSFWVLPLT